MCDMALKEESDLYSSKAWRDFNLGHPGGSDSTRKLLTSGGLKRGDRILDLCCGSGESVNVCHSFGLNATGIDRASVVDYAKQHYPEYSFCVWETTSGQEEKTRLPFDNHTFDAVLCECSYSLLDNKEDVLREISRVLTPTGKLLLSDVYDGTPFDLEGFVLVSWKDATEALRSFVAAWVWETGKRFPGTCEGSGYYLAVYKPVSAPEL